ncbi:hypothetical protein SAMN04487904_110129 [Actinopolyspora lacussalsi subsp. righensis]|uniref:Uncharacterized protein n=1 Tax=Actinopolyspora righensis TaxID=995060 RepID=A0A1I7BBY6_9ACTN|nr:hypothetical protein [Actinopolyspora righensis]SFT84730.1 hypothetical protein SAMN04487904_110129 [Actinopolyspora righensis]
MALAKSLAGWARTWRSPILLGASLIMSVALLSIARDAGGSQWLALHLPAVPGSDGILWQVQTTFLSVGFAGLAIAAQLFAEAPLAIGASRGRVLKYIGAGRFAGVGLVANTVIGIETIWLSSELGVLGIALFWFVPTVVLLVVSAVRLMVLYRNPSLLDEVVRTSLVESSASRLQRVSRRYSEATKQLDGLVTSSWSSSDLRFETVTLRVPVPQGGVVVKAIKPNAVKQALNALAPRATESRSAVAGSADVYTPPQITLDVEPGDRTRLGETAFRVMTPEALDEPEQGRIIRLLQSSIEFEALGAVTPDEETDREIANLKDAVGTSIRSGAFATAERAVELLGHVVRGVWMIQLDGVDSSRRGSFTRRDWLFRSIGEVEQDAVLSPHAAGMFVGQAMTRALEAPSAGSPEYVDECLRSFTRIWFDVLQQGGTEFDQLCGRIVVCVQNLAQFAAPDQHEDLSRRATWVMVELVKLALDAHKPEAAVRAAEELRGLFEYSDRHGTQRTHVRAGQLVLAGWLDYLADKGDDRDPADGRLRELVTPLGTWAEILTARDLAERGETPFSRWDWWEMKFSGSSHAQLLELSHYIDRSQLAALAVSYGPLPPVSDQETASNYNRLLRVLDERDCDLTSVESRLRERFVEEIAKWKAAEDACLQIEPLSGKRVDALRTSLAEALDGGQRLAERIPCASDVPEDADTSRPILGMNLRISRHYLVDKIFNQTYADPARLGPMIARGFTDGEERKIVGLLRSLQGEPREPSVNAIREQIDALGDQAEHYILLTPYGGLTDLNAWYSSEFSEALTRVTHIETSALDEGAIFYDSRTTLISCRKSEEKEGLAPVGRTSIAFGVFEEAEDGDEPQIRLEAGEYFVIWPGDFPRVFHFGAASVAEDNIDTGDGSVDPSTERS